MSFIPRLRSLRDEAQDFCRRGLAMCVRDIGDLIASGLARRSWAGPPQSHLDALYRAIEAAHDVAEVGDAAACISQRIFTGVNARAADLAVKGRSLLQVQDLIARTFSVRGFPRRGFVYVAWRARPTTYVYVGRAKGAQRLDLASHGKMANAVAHASTISILYPSQSRSRALSDIEASIIRLVEADTGCLPLLNEKRETVPVGPASRELEYLAEFMLHVAHRLRPTEYDVNGRRER